MVERKRAKNGILILGGGFAGSWVAHHLGKRGATVVSPDNFTLYTPMLPEAASGTLEPRHVVVPLRMMCKHSELVLGSAVRVDLTSREVEIESMVGRICITYERLVLAPGAVTRALPIPGLGEHAMPFKNLADAIHLRNHVLRRLEAAAEETDVAVCKEHLTFVFIGAGYAGVEALAELSDLVKDARRFYPSLADVQERWVLVDAAPKILPEIPRRLGEYAAKELAARGVDVRTKTTLNAVENGVAVLSDDTRIAARTIVWTAGVRAHPLLGDLGLPLAKRGRVKVDGTLRVLGRDDVWALGDCAEVPNAATPDHPDPPTCQHALRQARHLAKTLLGQNPKPYRYAMLGQVATLGRYRGVAEVFGLCFAGFIGWFLTRGYHLYQLPLPNRKLRVLVDWTVSLFFRRDIAELSVIAQTPHLDAPPPSADARQTK